MAIQVVQLKDEMSQKTPRFLAYAAGQDIFISKDVDHWRSVAQGKNVNMSFDVLCLKEMLLKHSNGDVRWTAGFLGLDFRARFTLEI